MKPLLFERRDRTPTIKHSGWQGGNRALRDQRVKEEVEMEVGKLEKSLRVRRF